MVESKLPADVFEKLYSMTKLSTIQVWTHFPYTCLAMKSQFLITVWGCTRWADDLGATCQVVEFKNASHSSFFFIHFAHIPLGMASNNIRPLKFLGSLYLNDTHKIWTLGTLYIAQHHAYIPPTGRNLSYSIIKSSSTSSWSAWHWSPLGTIPWKLHRSWSRTFPKMYLWTEIMFTKCLMLDWRSLITYAWLPRRC